MLDRVHHATVERILDNLESRRVNLETELTGTFRETVGVYDPAWDTVLGPNGKRLVRIDEDVSDQEAFMGREVEGDGYQELPW